MEILVNCDIIVASSDAKFSFPEVKRGVVAALGGGYQQRVWSSDLTPVFALGIPRIARICGHQVGLACNMDYSQHSMTS